MSFLLNVQLNQHVFNENLGGIRKAPGHCDVIHDPCSEYHVVILRKNHGELHEGGSFYSDSSRWVGF